MTAEVLAQTAAAPEAPRPMDMTRIIRIVGYVAMVLSLVSAAGTFFILMGLTPIAPTPSVVFTAMLVNGALVAVLLIVVAWEIISLVMADRRGEAAARLHIRIVGLFCLVAAAPAVLLAIAASFSLDRGLDNWFSTRTRAIVDNSLSIAQAYAEQQAVQLRLDAQAIRGQVEKAHDLLISDRERFEVFLSSLAAEQHMPGVFVVNGEGALAAQASTARQADYPPPPQGAIDQMKLHPSGIIVITPVGTSNILGGLTGLDGFNDLYLYVARGIDPRINRYLAMTNDNVTEYRVLEATRFGMQVAFGILFLGITVVVLLSSIWLGLGFANRLVAPIRQLIDAAKEVSRGNLEVVVVPRRSDGDVGALGVTFNTMTSQLRSQRTELLAASEQIDARRRFTEAVLSGVTAGVVGIEADGRVTIANRTALVLLGAGGDTLYGKRIAEIVPALAPILATALREGRPENRGQIVLMRDGRERTINVRVTTERTTGQAHGYVITLDDITDLVTAQRSSAWADIARRIAHEIKNPLTPIQLSAERLKRKFGRVIQDDREVFDQCTDTIIRQVGDIGRMVDEFSSFARMPKPAFVTGNLSEAIREAVFLISVAQPDIAFQTSLPDEPLDVRFDARLMGQALANIIKNATEAIAALPAGGEEKGRVEVNARRDGGTIVVDVIDNGIGLPVENRHRLLEPYVTTREKGTGLGLAIVTKIIEEHGGSVELMDAPSVAAGGHGAMICISLPALEGAAEGDAPDAAGATQEKQTG